MYGSSLAKLSRRLDAAWARFVLPRACDIDLKLNDPVAQVSQYYKHQHMEKEGWTLGEF